MYMTQAELSSKIQTNKKLESDFPWYDSLWLSTYNKAVLYISKNYPQKLDDFVKEIQRLKTSCDFSTIKSSEFINSKQHKKLKEIAQNLNVTEMEFHETNTFGRFTKHNHEEINVIQKELEPLVSELVNEEVESNYNFLSLYHKFGILPLHMDAPESKWTLDFCIDQSLEWPIYFSPPQDWPDHNFKNKNWVDSILKSTKFKKEVLTPGDGIIFSGSSQWHYREPLPTKKSDDFCHLVFFHFIPKGTQPLLDPNCWGEYFAIPQLNEKIQYDFKRF